VVRRPVAVTDEHGGDAVTIRPIANLCMSWDHRALDGALAARFLSAVRRHIEAYAGA
jgi:pyruvate/2-oxoglutarate dehydrogenase complex dihydrolipoamide acyltransferase (E2) component